MVARIASRALISASPRSKGFWRKMEPAKFDIKRPNQRLHVGDLRKERLRTTQDGPGDIRVVGGAGDPDDGGMFLAQSGGI